MSATDQAVASLCEGMLRSPSEIAGDTDSLLLGLLYSGSYTVNVLAAASANPYDLRQLALQSVHSGVGLQIGDPIEVLLDCSDFGEAVSGRTDPIETADILRAAISPRDRVPHYPFEVLRQVENAMRQGIQTDLHEHRDLREGMGELLVYLVSTLNLHFDAPKLREN